MNINETIEKHGYLVNEADAAVATEIKIFLNMPHTELMRHTRDALAEYSKERDAQDIVKIINNNYGVKFKNMEDIIKLVGKKDVGRMTKSWKNIIGKSIFNITKTVVEGVKKHGIGRIVTIATIAVGTFVASFLVTQEVIAFIAAYQASLAAAELAKQGAELAIGKAEMVAKAAEAKVLAAEARVITAERAEDIALGRAEALVAESIKMKEETLGIMKQYIDKAVQVEDLAVERDKWELVADKAIHQNRVMEYKMDELIIATGKVNHIGKFEMQGFGSMVLDAAKVDATDRYIDFTNWVGETKVDMTAKAWKLISPAADVTINKIQDVEKGMTIIGDNLEANAEHLETMIKHECAGCHDAETVARGFEAPMKKIPHGIWQTIMSLFKK